MCTKSAVKVKRFCTHRICRGENIKSQLNEVKEVISIFPKDRKKGKKQLIEWFLNNVMEDTRVQLTSGLITNKTLQIIDFILVFISP